ncbi:MAG: hypothetical protein ACE5FI_14660 [Anaerolineales bacterium]
MSPKLQPRVAIVVTALAVIFFGLSGVALFRAFNTRLPERLTVEDRLTAIAATQESLPPTPGLTLQIVPTENLPPTDTVTLEPTVSPIAAPPTSTAESVESNTAAVPNTETSLAAETATPGQTQTGTPAAPPTPTATIAAVAAVGSGPQPGPSPTWVLNYLPTPLPAFGPSKLGFHVTGNGQAMIDFAAAAQPAIMKGAAEIAFLEGVKQVSPNTVTIARYIVDDWQHNVGVGDPVVQAKAFVADQLPRYQEHAAYVDYWEGYNEIGVDKIAWYGQFEATRACEMQKHGLRAAIGSWSTGVPEPYQFEDFMPAIDAAIECGAILSLHEYGAPTYYLWWSQGLPPGPWYPDRGPLAGRYRWIYRDILIPRGKVVPLAITEAGIDGLVAMAQRPESDYTGPGWLNFRDFWVQEGLTDDPTQFYLDQLIWYDSILRQDSYVIGATIYTVAGGISPQQATYEAISLVPGLIDYMNSLR